MLYLPIQYMEYSEYYNKNLILYTLHADNFKSCKYHDNDIYIIYKFNKDLGRNNNFYAESTL
jgi:hypothetical protein